MATKNRKPLSGGAKLMASGKRPMSLGWPPDELAKIRQAAKKSGQYMTQFVVHHALMAAEEIIGKK